MGRKSTYKIGETFGKLKILEIIPSNKTGKAVKLNCLCGYCNNTKIIGGTLLRKRNSCGCQQRDSNEWKRKGPITKPWQLPSGVAAKKNLYYQYKRSAEKRKYEFALTSEEFDILIVGNCRYCGDSLTATRKGQGKTSGDFKYTGIDRIDNSVGYTIKNCVSCCWKCNNMKSSLPEEIFLSHITKVYKNNKNNKE